MHSTPDMTDEPAASPCSIHQTTDENLQDATGQQIPEVELESIRTEIAEQCRPAPPFVDPAIRCEAKAEIEGIESSATRESTPHAQSSQHFRHDSTLYDVLERTADDSQRHPNVCSHVTNPLEDRDLERGDPFVPPSVLSESQPEHQESFPSAANGSMRYWAPVLGREIKLLKDLLMTERDQLLIDSLRSIAGDSGEEIYRRHALGYGHRKRYGWFVEATFNKISADSSNQDVWWLNAFYAIFWQHLISRWIHGGHRKHFETRFCMETAVYLLQNIGDPSDRWINDTLKKSLGLDPQFFHEHLALVYDGGLITRGEARPQLCPRAWHIWAVLSDEQVMTFSSLETFPATDSAALECASFQRTDTDSCKSE
jgi:hypothetical protein